jgi:hypothetical protein
MSDNTRPRGTFYARLRHEAGTLDPYYYAREHDGSGWSVRGPNGFALKMPPDQPLDKNIAFIIAKLLSGKLGPAESLLRDLVWLHGVYDGCPDNALVPPEPPEPPRGE